MYTWNEIYENDIDKACGSSELRAKDEARFQVRNLIIDLGAPPLDESEVPEDVVEDYCKSLNIKFDECGNIVSLELPHWIEDIIYKRKDDAYLEKDLNATAQSLFGTDIEITDEQMQQMVLMYRHNEDCNVAINDTLEDTVRRVLKR